MVVLLLKRPFILSSHGSGMIQLQTHTLQLLALVNALYYIYEYTSVHFNDLQLLRHECKFDSLRISIQVRPAWLKGRDVMVKLYTIISKHR